MAINQARFDELVAHLTVASERAPGAYKLKVALLALAGYAYIFFVLAVLALLTALLVVMLVAGKAAVIALKLGIPLLVLVWIILRALWVRLTPPAGHPLTRAQAPKLFETIDEIRAATRGPRTHQVLLTEEFNAAVTQIPRLGLFGWQKNFLIIGLPLMQALSPQQFKAVLCHEYGHLSRSHAQFGAWVYRMRLTWARLMGALEGMQHWGAFVFRRFVRWYVPYFNAYSFVLARANEYEADRFAARVCGADTAASALSAVEVRARYLSDRYWPEVYQAANRESTPSFAPFAALPSRYSAGLCRAFRGRRQHLARAGAAAPDRHRRYASGPGGPAGVVGAACAARSPPGRGRRAALSGRDVGRRDGGVRCVVAGSRQGRLAAAPRIRPRSAEQAR